MGNSLRGKHLIQLTHPNIPIKLHVGLGKCVLPLMCGMCVRVTTEISELHFKTAGAQEEDCYSPADLHPAECQHVAHFIFRA